MTQELNLNVDVQDTAELRAVKAEINDAFNNAIIDEILAKETEPVTEEELAFIRGVVAKTDNPFDAQPALGIYRLTRNLSMS